VVSIAPVRTRQNEQQACGNPRGECKNHEVQFSLLARFFEETLPFLEQPQAVLLHIIGWVASAAYERCPEILIKSGRSSSPISACRVPSPNDDQVRTVFCAGPYIVLPYDQNALGGLHVAFGFARTTGGFCIAALRIVAQVASGPVIRTSRPEFVRLAWPPARRSASALAGRGEPVR